MSETDYGIVANNGLNRRFRKGALCWIVGGLHGDGWERREFWGIAGGRRIHFWALVKDFRNFRPRWIPESLRDISIKGTKEQMLELCKSLNERQKGSCKCPICGGTGKQSDM